MRQCLLFIAYCLLFIAYCLLLIAYSNEVCIIIRIEYYVQFMTARPYAVLLSIVFMEQVPSDEEEDNELTVVSHLTASAVPTQANMTYVLHPSQSKTLASSLNLDDRPITPMKNRMVYDVKHSTLDFKDGKHQFHNSTKSQGLNILETK